MKASLIAFLKDEEGASAIEYALMAVMVAIAIMTVSSEISTKVVLVFEKIRDALTLK